MLSLDPYLLLLLTACLYILVFGALSLLRREGLSVQFALEAIGLTVLLVGGSWLIGVLLNPVLFVVILYLVTMRSRLIVDVANMWARQGQYGLAFKLYRLGLAWWPDVSSRLIVLMNRGAAELHKGEVETAIQTLEGVLSTERRSRLGLKYEAACCYNLGYAYERKGDEARSIARYHEAIELLPGSIYARAAQAALKRRQRRKSGD